MLKSPMAPPPDPTELAWYDYPLDPARIAKTPRPERDGALLLDGTGDRPAHRRVRDLPSLARPGDLFVFNDTKVRRARLHARRASGARLEILVLTVTEDGVVRAWVKGAGRLRPGERLRVEGVEDSSLLCQTRDGDAWSLRWDAADGPADGRSIEEVMERAGEIPWPPYLAKTEADRTALRGEDARYQTVFAGPVGSAAAPTAGLHFTEELLRRLDEAGARRVTVTLHIGPGTFQGVSAEHVADHVMHEERYSIPAAAADAWNECRARGGRVIAVGTTALRTLETCFRARGRLEAGAGSTRLFVHPPQTVGAADLLFTNFHLPKSTLLMLISAFAGADTVRALYDEALRGDYRFFSLGDACLLANQAFRARTGAD